MREIKYLWLNNLPGSNKYKHQLLNHFGDIETLYNTGSDQLCKIGCTSKQVEQFIESKTAVDQLARAYIQMREEGIEVMTFQSSRYPERLKEIFDPPIVLFGKGNIHLLHQPSIAIVGARKCSEYGFSVAKHLAYELARCGITVVSGMAKGVDEASHKGTLEFGSTIAVLGTGVNVCYPKENQRLYEAILERGCIVSEYLPYTKPMKYQFPQRNRIISGLSLGTVVVEAEERSGSLITAQLSLEQGREVFAIPGNIHSVFSKGTNKLIQEGAKLVMNIQDILEELHPQLKCAKNAENENNYKSVNLRLDNLQIIVYDCLSWQPIQIESIASKLDIKIEMIEMILLQLEIKGLIQRLPGRRYSRSK